MNDEPLPANHGYPARLIVPGLYGYVSATKWLAEIELTTLEAFDAYWVPLGWSKEGPILTQSRIDVPQHGPQVAAGRVADRRRRLGARPRRHEGRDRGRRRRGRRRPCRPRSRRRPGSSGVSTGTRPRRATHPIEVRATDGTGDVQTDQVHPAGAGRRARPPHDPGHRRGRKPAVRTPRSSGRAGTVIRCLDDSSSSIPPTASSPAPSASRATGRSSSRPATAGQVVSVALEKVQVAVLAERLGLLLDELETPRHRRPVDQSDAPATPARSTSRSSMPSGRRR